MTKETKFTPGPWFVTETDGTWVEDGKTPIAPICNYVGPEQRAANAHLIAAAPELLEALELALEYWAHRQQRYKNRHPAWVQSARAAIAKAQGD